MSVISVAQVHSALLSPTNEPLKRLPRLDLAKVLASDEWAVEWNGLVVTGALWRLAQAASFGSPLDTLLVIAARADNLELHAPFLNMPERVQALNSTARRVIFTGLVLHAPAASLRAILEQINGLDGGSLAEIAPLTLLMWRGEFELAAALLERVQPRLAPFVSEAHTAILAGAPAPLVLDIWRRIGAARGAAAYESQVLERRLLLENTFDDVGAAGLFDRLFKVPAAAGEATKIAVFDEPLTLAECLVVAAAKSDYVYTLATIPGLLGVRPARKAMLRAAALGRGRILQTLARAGVAIGDILAGSSPLSSQQWQGLTWAAAAGRNERDVLDLVFAPAEEWTKLRPRFRSWLAAMAFFGRRTERGVTLFQALARLRRFDDLDDMINAVKSKGPGLLDHPGEDGDAPLHTLARLIGEAPQRRRRDVSREALVLFERLLSVTVDLQAVNSAGETAAAVLARQVGEALTRTQERLSNYDSTVDDRLLGALRMLVARDRRTDPATPLLHVAREPGESASMVFARKSGLSLRKLARLVPGVLAGRDQRGRDFYAMLRDAGNRSGMIALLDSLRLDVPPPPPIEADLGQVYSVMPAWLQSAASDMAREAHGAAERGMTIDEVDEFARHLVSVYTRPENMSAKEARDEAVRFFSAFYKVFARHRRYDERPVSAADRALYAHLQVADATRLPNGVEGIEGLNAGNPWLLYEAIMRGRPAAVMGLLGLGADPSAIVSLGSTGSNSRIRAVYSPLLHLAVRRMMPIIGLVLAYTPHTDVTDSDGNTCLHAACRDGANQAIEAIVAVAPALCGVRNKRDELPDDLFSAELTRVHVAAYTKLFRAKRRGAEADVALRGTAGQRAARAGVTWGAPRRATSLP